MRFIILALGAALLPFGTQRYSVALAAILAPILLMRFMRTAPTAGGGFAGVYAAILVAQLVVHTPAYTGLDARTIAVLAPIVALLHALGYLLDDRLRARLPLRLGLLVFPCYFVALEFLAMRAGPFGSNDLIAYSLGRVPGLLQLASVTGLAGLGFLVYAVAPAANHAWEARGRAGAPLAAAVAAIGAVWLGGEIRLALNPPAPGGVPVAAVALDAATYDAVLHDLDMRDVARGDSAIRGTLRARTAPAHEQLFAKTERAVAAGARLVAWPETTIVLEEDLDALLGRARELARTHRVFLVVAPWVVRRSEAFPFGRNLSIGIGPDGAERWRYDKQHPVPGMELAIAPGASPAPVVDSELGRIGSAICFDNDFPQLVRASARDGADLWVAPSDDWPGIARAHSSAFALRAIEEGVSLVKPTHNGVSVIIDPYGRTLAELDTLESTQPFVMASVPRAGVATIYARAGDWFAWLAVLALAIAIGHALIARRPALVTALET